MLVLFLDHLRKERKTKRSKINLGISPGINNIKIPYKLNRVIIIRMTTNLPVTVLEVLPPITEEEDLHTVIDHQTILQVATKLIPRGISIANVVLTVREGTTCTNNRVGIVASLALNIGARIVMNLFPDPGILINPLERVFPWREKRIQMPHSR